MSAFPSGERSGQQKSRRSRHRTEAIRHKQYKQRTRSLGMRVRVYLGPATGVLGCVLTVYSRQIYRTSVRGVVVVTTYKESWGRAVVSVCYGWFTLEPGGRAIQWVDGVSCDQCNSAWFPMFQDTEPSGTSQHDSLHLMSMDQTVA